MDHDPVEIDISAAPTPERLPNGVVLLSPLDARVLRAADPSYIRSVARVAKLAGCGEDLAASALRRLRVRMLVEDDGRRPMGWLRTHRGELFLEHQP
jgi:hypothetical protein